MRRASPALLAAALAAAVALVAGTATLWPRDHPTTAPASAPAPTATQPAPDPATLPRLVDEVVEAGTPGAVALVRTGQPTWQGVGGQGDLAARRPPRPADRFRIGSVTRSFVVTVVLQLVAEGKLRLDDHVRHWLGGVVPGGERITIRQLLNHQRAL